MEARLDKYLQVVTPVTPRPSERERIHPEEQELFFEIANTLDYWAQRTFENLYRKRKDWREDLWDAWDPLNHIEFGDVIVLAHCSVSKWGDTKRAVLTFPREVLAMTPEQQGEWATKESNRVLKARKDADVLQDQSDRARRRKELLDELEKLDADA